MQTDPPVGTDPAPATPPAEPAQATPTTEPSEETKALANEQLRAWANQTAEENKELKALAMRSALGEIGLNAEEGLGLAIVESFDGKITDEAVAKYAQEKYRYGTGQQPAAPTTPDVQAAQRADALNAAGQSVTPTPQPTAGQQATEKVDGNDPEAGRQEAIQSTTVKMGDFMGRFYPQQ